MTVRYHILTWFTFFSSLSFAAEWKSPGANIVTTRIGIVVPTLEIETKPRDPLTGHSLKFKPDMPNRSFISLAYDWFGISASAVNPVSSEQERLFGTTKASDYQFRFYFTYLSLEAFYQKYKGYYIDNTQDVISGWNNSQPRRLYPEMSTEHTGISATYVYSPDHYSMAAAFDQSAIQTESGGSWLSNFSASSHHLDNPGPIVPVEMSGGYGEFEKVKSGHLLAASIGFGGGYNFIPYDRFYLSAVGILNLGTQVLHYEKTNGDGNKSISGTAANIKLGLGYNGDRFITGAYLLNNVSTFNIENVDTSFQTLELSFFLGTRFGM